LRDSFGSAELARIEEGRVSPEVISSVMEEIISEAGANHMGPRWIDTETFHELPRVTAVEDDEPVVARYSRADLFGEVGTEFHLPEAGCMTVTDNPSAGGDVFEQCRHYPQVVGVDEVRPKCGNDRPQMFDPRMAVGGDSALIQRRKPGARVGHDVTHSRDWKIERRFAERKRVNLFGLQPTDGGFRVVGRHSDRDALLPSGCRRVTN
jgi:hypothetical protein